MYRLRPWMLLVKHHAIHKALINKKRAFTTGIIIYLDRKYFDRIMPEAGLMDCF